MIELGLILYSLHIYTGNSETRLENTTPGIVATYVDTGTSVGVVRNSYRRTSFFVSQQLWEKGRWSINAGAITGYDYAPVLPLVSLNLQVTKNLSMSFVPPKLDGEKYGTIVTVFTFK
jgi:hypothetical protein